MTFAPRNSKVLTRQDLERLLVARQGTATLTEWWLSTSRQRFWILATDV